MKAVRMVAPGQPLELQQIPIPAAGEEDLLVRVRAAGICHSDAHYRAGRSPMGMLPITLGHEVAGEVEWVGARVTNVKAGERVCLHYNLSCGECGYCKAGHEQFCAAVKMIGHHVDGGYAEYITIPARNAIPLPEEISFAEGATLMCASATALHALHKGRVQAGETVAVFGVGGLGMSAIQLAKALGAVEVYAVDIQPDKLELAAQYGAIPVDARRLESAQEIRRLTRGQGVDVALEMVGLPETLKQTVASLGPLGRAVVVGICSTPLEVDPYRTLIGYEAEIIGSNDHLLQELPVLIDMRRRGILDTSHVVSQSLPLEAEQINQRLDDLETYTPDVRAVIVQPG